MNPATSESISPTSVDPAALQRAAGALFHTLQRASEQHQRLQRMMQVSQRAAAAPLSEPAADPEPTEGDLAVAAAEAPAPAPTMVEPSDASDAAALDAPPARPGPRPSPYSVENWLTRRLQQFHEVEARIEAREQKLLRLHLAISKVVNDLQGEVRQAQESRQSLQAMMAQSQQWVQTRNQENQQQLQQTQQRFEDYLHVLADADEALNKRVQHLQQEAGTLLEPVAEQLRLSADELAANRVDQVRQEVEDRFAQLEHQLVSRLQNSLNAAQDTVLGLEQRIGLVQEQAEENASLEEIGQKWQEHLARMQEEAQRFLQEADTAARQQIMERVADMQHQVDHAAKGLAEQIRQSEESAGASVASARREMEWLQVQRERQDQAMAEQVQQAQDRIHQFALQFQEQLQQQLSQAQQWLQQQGEQWQRQAQDLVMPVRQQMDSEVVEVEQRCRAALQSVRDHAHRFATALDTSVARMALRARTGLAGDDLPPDAHGA